MAPFRKDLALSERIMKRRHWTLARCQVSHPAAERRWDQAYQQLLGMLTSDPGIPDADPPTGTPEESRHARSHLRPGVDPAPSRGADD